MNKIIIYDNDTLLLNKQTIPEFFNKNIADIEKNGKINFITFIRKDLYERCKDANKFIKSYKDFLVEYDLPYVFFPYLSYFNRQLPAEMSIPNPRLNITYNTDKAVQVVTSPTPGFLLLDIKKLNDINFTFNNEYTELFYLQDLIQACFDNKLWISNCFYLDRINSWTDVNESEKIIFSPDAEKFKNERELYNKKQFVYQNINEFIKLLKENLNK